MNINVYNAVVALLEVDVSLSASDKVKILAVCKHPDNFSEPDERKPPRLLSINETIKHLGMSRTTLWRMTKDGVIRCVRFRAGGSPHYSLDDITELLNKEKSTSPL